MIPPRRRPRGGRRRSVSNNNLQTETNNKNSRTIPSDPSLLPLTAHQGGGSISNLNSSLSNIHGNPLSGNRKRTSLNSVVQRSHTNRSLGDSNSNNKGNNASRFNASTSTAGDSCWDCLGLNFLIPALTIWSVVAVFVWWPVLKDNALDYYYLQYPEQQPLSPIPGTVLPLIPNVWIYDPDKAKAANKDNQKEGFFQQKEGSIKMDSRKTEIQTHLREHRQPHYYMLPEDYYDQQPWATPTNSTTTTKVRGILIILHSCHQSGLHAFQLPESRLVVAKALQRGFVVFSPTASAAPKLLTINTKLQPGGKGTAANNNINNNNRGGGTAVGGGAGNEKNCWSSELDGQQLLRPLLYEWAREMDMLSLPRVAIGISNGANLLMASSLYKSLRLQSMALYGSHFPDGFNTDDLDHDIIPATAFVVFPKNTKATEYAMQHYDILQHKQEEDEAELELRKEEEREELEKQKKDEEEDEQDSESGEEDSKEKPRARFFRKTHLWEVNPHDWTPSLCQARLPEYHTRCRSFFRFVQKFQQARQRRQELKDMKRDPKERAKRLRLAAGGLKNPKQKFQLISATGEVLQSSKSTQWIPVMEKLLLDDWTTHTMAFTLASYAGQQHDTDNNKGNNNNAQKKNRFRKKQLNKFPTTATPEGRSWLWASMLQEIEVAYGVQEMTSEHAGQILDFLMYHAGLPLSSA